jgi:MFS superfamily sulfate permease-like transporter
VACANNLNLINEYSVFLGIFTLFATRKLMKVSPLIPGPVVSIGLATLLASTLFRGQGVILVGDVYGSIPTNFFKFTPPQLPALSLGVLADIGYFVLAIVFVSAVESLLCSSMADRLAQNKGTPFNPDKEFWGQGLVQIITPLINGFPCTGALARTATSIKAGAVTPLAGYFKGVLKLLLAVFLAPLLQMIPMACIGGILLWVASNMIKPAEIREVIATSRFDTFMMAYTAIMVPMTDFLTGVLSALILYYAARKVVPGLKGEQAS